MVILVTFNKLISCKRKHNNVYITNPLLIWTRAVIMAFVTSKLIVEEVEAEILLIDDVSKMVILIYSYETSLQC